MIYFFTFQIFVKNVKKNVKALIVYCHRSIINLHSKFAVFEKSDHFAVRNERSGQVTGNSKINSEGYRNAIGIEQNQSINLLLYRPNLFALN